MRRVVMFMLAIAPMALSGQEEKVSSEIGFYAQGLTLKDFDGKATNVMHSLIKGYAYQTDKVGLWGFAYGEKGYASSTVGLFYDFTDYFEVGVAGGAETIRNEEGYYQVFGRGAVSMLIGTDKLFVEAYYENGASKEGWYEVDAMWRPSNRFGLGILAQKGVGTGPRVLVQPLRGVPLEIFVAPYMYNTETKQTNSMLGVQLVFKHRNRK